MSSLRGIWASVTQYWGKLRMVWNETGSTLKSLWIALWIIGAILLSLGIWGDNTGFWADKPYLTNTFSALTSAAFGVPVALVVLQRAAALESDAAEARAARRMAGRVAADLASTVAALVSDGIPAMESLKVQLRDQCDVLVPNGDYWRPSTAPRLYYQPFIAAIGNSIERIDEIFAPETRRHLAEVSTLWSILTTESRSRLLGSGSKWLTGLQVEELDALIIAVTGPTLRDWRKRGLKLQDWYRDEDRKSENASRHYGEMDTLREFASWFGEIIDYIDAVMALTTKSAFLEQALASQ